MMSLVPLETANYYIESNGRPVMSQVPTETANAVTDSYGNGQSCQRFLRKRPMMSLVPGEMTIVYGTNYNRDGQ